MSDAVKKTPTEWQMEEEFNNLEISDADGWQGPDAPSWDTPITREEFMERRMASTVRTKVDVRNYLKQ